MSVLIKQSSLTLSNYSNSKKEEKDLSKPFDILRGFIKGKLFSSLWIFVSWVSLGCCFYVVGSKSYAQPEFNVKGIGLRCMHQLTSSGCQNAIHEEFACQLEYSKTRIVLVVARLITIRNFTLFACIPSLPYLYSVNGNSGASKSGYFANERVGN